MKWNAPPPVALGVRRKAQLPASTWVVECRRIGGFGRASRLDGRSLGSSAAEEPVHS